MKLFLLKIFTWWSGQTFGTQLWTWRFGELVGEDEQGNRYYRTAGRKIDPTLGFERRWVVYNGYAEASKVPPSWHGWLHHTVDIAPTEENYVAREWQKPHIPNMTGTPAAYRPDAPRWPAAAVPQPPAITSRGRRGGSELRRCVRANASRQSLQPVADLARRDVGLRQQFSHREEAVELSRK
jgi:NADH:ubiquinone oxidoreductase subunit